MPERRLHPTRVATLTLAALVLASLAHAAAPPPLSNPAYGFPLPGDFPAAASAASAGLSLADRWLGESPYENPAADVKSGLEVSPLFQRVSRQDLTSRNRDVDQTVGYPDLAGGSIGLPWKGLGITLYAWQPVLRLEEQVYSSGPLATPAQVRQLASQRELRAGLALSHAIAGVRVGASGEFVHRDDKYETHEQSGSPQAGDRVLEWSGDSFGGSLGVAWSKDPDRPWGSWFGAALHYGSSLDVTGTLDEQLVAGSQQLAVAATRDAEWSGGASARVTIAPATRVVVGVSGRSGADWQGFDFGTTAGASWSAGLDWKDPELPWGARFGVGQEANPGAIERKSGLLSVGFQWVSGDLGIDVGLLHRNLAREGYPNSADDRAVATVKVAF